MFFVVKIMNNKSVVYKIALYVIIPLKMHDEINTIDLIPKEGKRCCLWTTNPGSPICGILYA